MSLMDALLLDPYGIDPVRPEVWIAPRTDGVSGNGTENDPYDGSTQAKFDQKMGVSLQGLTNMLIHLGPGTFQTLGFPTVGGWYAGSGWKIIGSGMEVTVVKLVGVPANSNTSAIGSLYPDNIFLTGFEASDLTIDCNLAGQTANVTCEAVAVTGAHNRLRRIRVINFGTTYNGSECFALSPTAANADIQGEVVDNWMDACILEQPGLSNAAILTFMNHAAGESAGFKMAYHRACVIRNCFVDGEFRINPLPIATIAIDVFGVATVTTRLPHGYVNGQYVRISGAVVGGSTNNSYNGSYSISSVTPPYGFQYTPFPTQSVNPTGDLWLGRFSSQVVETTTFQPISGKIVQVTTASPHFRLVGDYVLIVLTNNPFLNGYFPVTEVVGYKDFRVLVNQDSPGAGIGGFIAPLFQCCSADGGTAAVVEGNRFVNARVSGPYHDTWSSKDLTVRNNYHRAVVVGPYQNVGLTDASVLGTRDCSLSNIGLMATLTSGTDHHMETGETVWVTGASRPQYEGFFVVTKLSSTELTYQMAQNPNGPSLLAQYARLFQLGRIIIENNWIELVLNILSTGYGPPSGIDFSNNVNPDIKPPTFLTLQAAIRRNQIQSLDGVVDGSKMPTGIWPNNCANGVVEENVIDLNSLQNGPAVRQLASGSVSYLNNQTPSGNLIEGYNGDTNVYVAELATDIDLALMHSF